MKPFTRFSFTVTFHSFFVSFSFVQAFFFSLLSTRCSLLFAYYSLFFIFLFIFVTHSFFAIKTFLFNYYIFLLFGLVLSKKYQYQEIYLHSLTKTLEHTMSANKNTNSRTEDRGILRTLSSISDEAFYSLKLSTVNYFGNKSHLRCFNLF